MKTPRKSANMAMLEHTARQLGKLNDEVVFVGGCTTALFITDPLALDVRATLDVDCIIDVFALTQYNQFKNKLRAQGFKESLQNDVICRWYYNDIILDVMPIDESILGFGNLWYKEAITKKSSHQITNDLSISSITAPYFIATKLEAFKTRGNKDFFASHDLEDIITVIDGRIEIVDEITASSPILKEYLEINFSEFLKDDQFILALPGHLNAGPVAQDRTRLVLNRILEIANTG